MLEWLVIAVFAITLVTALVVGRVTERLDHVFYDSLVGFYAPPPSDRILLVTIDNQSIATIGKWPWPRTVHARLLERLQTARPAVVAYDVLFTEPGNADDDARLAAAQQALGRVILPTLFEAPGHNGSLIDAVPPSAPIAAAARAIGHVGLLPDDDGTVRSIPLSMSASGRNWPHLMELAHRIALGHDSPAYRRQAAAVAVPFQPYQGGFRTISFANVLAGEVPAEFMRNRIVLVGATAAGLGDRYDVPQRSGGPISGLEVQANLLNSLLADRAIVTPRLSLRLALATFPCLALLVAFWWLGPGRAFAASLTLVGLALVVPALLLALGGIWLAPFPALVGLLLVYPLWGWRRLQAVHREIDQELEAFSKEPTPVPLRADAAAQLDPVGGQTQRLREAIAGMRDLRRLVSDTLESVRDPLLVTDLDDFVLLANQPATTVFGPSWAGQGAAGLLARAAGMKINRGALPPEIGIAERVFSLYRSPLRDSEGDQRGWILHLHDITAIRAAEREREAALEFLSHDMRSPQSSIITLIERHREVLGDANIVRRITALARRTLALADNFVELARLEAAQFRPEELNLGDVLIEAADDLWSQASSCNVRIDLEGVDTPHFMLGEHETLRRTLVNLLDNAVKFSPSGGAVHCTLTRTSDGWLECTIEDSGPGIPPERRADLFGRFGARQKSAGSHLSAGLGLAYVGAAVGRHGGEISCTARKPHGTCFVLRFVAIA